MFKFILISAAVAASYAWAVWAGMPDMAIISATGALYVSGQLIYTNMLPVGHGVDNSPHILSMPAVTFFFYVLVLALIVGLMASLWGAQETQVGLGLHAFAFSAFLGWLAALLDWYLSSSRLTHFAEERRMRSILEMRGLSAREIDAIISLGHSHGMFGDAADRKK